MNQSIENGTRRYQCRDCVYAYDPLLGDPTQGVAPGTHFDDLPSTWVCPICRASKQRFKPCVN